MLCGISTKKAAMNEPGTREINEAFNIFLRISEQEKALLAQYHPLLIDGADRFIEAFYAYLLAFPITADVLHRYQETGGELFKLAATQSEHFQKLLSGCTDEQSAEQLIRIGKIHYQHKIEPVWIMGAYQLYLNHIRQLIAAHPEITPDKRSALESILIKLLFRDMGLMLEGYWHSAMSLMQAEKNKVTELQERVSSLLANLPQVLWSVDVKNNLPIYVSPATKKICSLDIEMPIPCLGCTHPDDRETVKLALAEALRGNKEIIERLHSLATTDSLTALPNRTLFSDRLNQAIAMAKRERNKRVVLMLMDMDHFKEINDTLGHPAGDEVLRQVAQRLARLLRESDTLARLGGDEFAILLSDIQDPEAAAEKIAKNILGSFAEPFWYQENELYLGAGIGIAIFPDHGGDADALMSRADVAMYSAKHKDVGFLFYNPKTDPHTQERLQLSSDLRHALNRNEFVLHYQPQIDIRSSRVIGVEALIRWNHPEHGLIPPDQFIPFAERTGLINPITDWVIHTAITQCKAWQTTDGGLRIAVNMTARSFLDPKLMDKLEGLLPGACPAGQIEIEITENILMADIEHGAKAIRRLRDLGITVAIDDFGTGYSSLAYLKKLPIHSIKIDKSFVLNMAEDDNDAVIVRSTIDLAHNLGFLVVAEGVENRDALDLLAVLGCDHAQGYHIGRPLPADELIAWIKKSPWRIQDT